jgi:cytidylate kinase
MSIISISRDSYSHGEDIAKAVAEKLGYKCIGPEIIQHACQCLDFPFSTLQKSLHEAPTFLERISARKEQYLAIFRSLFFEYMAQDSIVYHGLAGHILLADVPNVLKVRVIADFEDRIEEKVGREHLPYGEAEKRLLREDNERARWARQTYGKDDHDPRLYDLYLNLHNISRDAAVSIIIGTAQVSTNGNEEMMRKKLRDMALAAKTEARLLELFPELVVVAKDGEVFVSVNGSLLQEERIRERARRMVSGIEGIRKLNIGVEPSIYVPF